MLEVCVHVKGVCTCGDGCVYLLNVCVYLLNVCVPVEMAVCDTVMCSLGALLCCDWLR